LFAFTIFLYVFINKVEKDAHEFKVLNHKLEDKVMKEVTQRLEQEKMLLRQCRMANMGEMIDAIAHQWRQPLMNINAVLMNIDILSTDEKNKEIKFEQYMDEISQLTSHMSQTIEDFRTLYQEEKEKSSFVLYALIENVILLMKNNFQGIQIHMPSEIEMTIVNYKSELSQVFITLFSNAIEVLKLREVSVKQIFIELKQSETFTFISIEDNAGGIVEKNIYNIFDPYFTTKKQTGGTGLGLHITQIIIEQNMKGSISVSNTERGAKFLISLPRNITL
jgi:C4-dicarboxylate-specific signal transduction histidine kinase